MNKKPTELTHEGIRQILQNDKIAGIFQILSIEEDKTNIYRVNISDGFSKKMVIFAEEAGQKCQADKDKKLLHSVIELKEGFTKKAKEGDQDNTIIFVRKFDILYQDLSSSIGEPLEYNIFKQAGYHNPQGKTEISSATTNKNSVDQKKKSHAILLTNNEPTENFMTLNMLSMMTEKWRIKARIIRKTEKRTWKNVKGEGTLFSIDIVDCNGTEMNCSFFNKSCEKWFDLLECDKTYVFSGGNVKMNNQKYNQTSDYQIVFDERTEIQIVDNDPAIIKQKFLFLKINKINDLPLGANVDIAGIVKDPGLYQEVNVKNSQTTRGRRNIQLIDDTLTGVEMTLWGDLALKDFKKDAIILIKNAKINEFKDTRNLTSTFQTSIHFDEFENEAYKSLENWRNSVSSEEIEQISVKDKLEKKIYRTKTLAQVEEEAKKLVNSFDERVYSDIKAHIMVIKNDERVPLYYLACTNEKCAKKLIEEMDGWKCESCNKTYKEPHARYILQAKIADESCSLWVSLFDTVGNIILGKTANEVRIMKEQKQTELLNDLIRSVSFKQMKMRVFSRIESYNGESRVKHQVLKVFPKDNAYECRVLTDEIEEYLNLGTEKNVF